jgi:hypothetical protein
MTVTQMFDPSSISVDEFVIDQLASEAAYDGNLQLQIQAASETLAAISPSPASSSAKTATLELPPSDATSGQGGRYSGQVVAGKHPRVPPT